MTTPGPRVKTPAGSAPLVPVILLGIGGYLAWFGVHYWRSDVKWPTTPVKDVLQGKGVPAATVSKSPEENAVEQLAQAAGGVTPSTGQAQPNALGQAVASGTAPTPASSTAAHNQQIGKMLATSYGWGSGQQWNDLVLLWNQESGWNNQAENPTSHAYGIPQSLPWTKMPKAAWPPRAGGKADPTAQISWGLAYIKGRYGSPSAAWAHERAYNWY